MNRIDEFHTVSRTCPEGLDDVLGVLYLDVDPETGVVCHVRFLCPCGDPGCLHILPVHKQDGTLNAYGKACWGFEEHDDGTVTLTPSILRRVHRNNDGMEFGCGSHFFIRRNKVVWA